MTLIKDLPNSTNVINIKVRIPDDIFNDMSDQKGAEKEMWIMGSFMGELWFTPTPPSEDGKGERLLIMFPRDTYEINRLLEFEVIEYS